MTQKKEQKTQKKGKRLRKKNKRLRKRTNGGCDRRLRKNPQKTQKKRTTSKT